MPLLLHHVKVILEAVLELRIDDREEEVHHEKQGHEQEDDEEDRVEWVYFVGGQHDVGVV